MSGRGRSGNGGFISIGRLPLPPHAPGSLHQLARAAKVRDALGGALGAHLADVVISGPQVTLVFEGDDLRLGPMAETLATVVARALGRERVDLVLEHRPASDAPARGGTAVPEDTSPEGVDARLAAIAERLLARRGDPR